MALQEMAASKHARLAVDMASTQVIPNHRSAVRLLHGCHHVNFIGALQYEPRDHAFTYTRTERRAFLTRLLQIPHVLIPCNSTCMYGSLKRLISHAQPAAAMRTRSAKPRTQKKKKRTGHGAKNAILQECNTSFDSVLSIVGPSRCCRLQVLANPSKKTQSSQAGRSVRESFCSSAPGNRHVASMQLSGHRPGKIKQACRFEAWFWVEGRKPFWAKKP